MENKQLWAVSYSSTYVSLVYGADSINGNIDVVLLGIICLTENVAEVTQYPSYPPGKLPAHQDPLYSFSANVEGIEETRSPEINYELYYH